jgi:hypothetical protein
MTIAQLLSHHGLREPRWIEVNGKVAFGPPAVGTDMTALEPHTFHGGDDPEDTDVADTPWWQDDQEVARHVDAVKTAFPAFILMPDEDDGPPSFGGLLDTGRGKFKVLVIMRRDGGLPFVHVVGPRLGRQEGRRWRHAPHTYTSGAICVADQSDWRQGQHSAATVIAWAAHWLAAYTEWRFTGRWPVEGYVPDVA